MPNKNFRPDQPEYYNSIRKLDTLNNLIGGIPATINKEEIANAFANENNFRAYAISCLPKKASSKAVIDAALKKAPRLRIDESQQQERRRLSEKARQAIVEAAARKVMGQNNRKINDRLDALFFLRGTDSKTREKNDELVQRIQSTPEERGRLLEELVNNSMEMYQRILAGTVTKEELVDNFEQIHIVLDLVMNATNFLSGSVEDKDGKIYIKFTPEIKDILVDMESHSTEVALFVNKIRIMANPNYEFMDLEQVLDLDNETYEAIDTYAMMDANDPVLEDALLIPGTDRTIKKSCGRDNLMKRISKDFPEEFKEARLEFIGTDGKFRTMQYSTEHKIAKIEENVHKDDILVTLPSGKRACYHLDNTNGRVQEVDSSGLFGKVPALAANVLKDLKKANKGLFFGSKEYKNALEGMPEVLNSIKEVGNPPDLKKMEEASAKIQTVLAECEKYLDRKRHDPKNPDLSLHDIWKGMSQREKNRYTAMEQAALYCKAQLNVYALKQQEIKAEMNANLDRGAQEVAAVYKAETVYGKDAALAASNVGTIADELRADIDGSLKRMLNGEFDIDEARETFSNMVLLEVIKRGRSMDGGTLVAGDMEAELAAKPENMVRRMRNYPAVKAACEDMTLDKLCQFVRDGSAKTLAVKVIAAAKDYNPDAKANELQVQNQQIQKEEHTAVMQ